MRERKLIIYSSGDKKSWQTYWYEKKDRTVALWEEKWLEVSNDRGEFCNINMNNVFAIVFTDDERGED